jgi:hypothetical protein
MIIELDDGDLRATVVDGKVALTARDVQGDPPKHVNVQLRISPGAARNLGLVLPDLADEVEREQRIAREERYGAAPEALAEARRFAELSGHGQPDTETREG